MVTGLSSERGSKITLALIETRLWLYFPCPKNPSSPQHRESCFPNAQIQLCAGAGAGRAGGTTSQSHGEHRGSRSAPEWARGGAGTSGLGTRTAQGFGAPGILRPGRAPAMPPSREQGGTVPGGEALL